MGRTSSVRVESSYIRRKTNGESIPLDLTDAKVRRHGEQTGLDTLVVHAVNDEY